MSAMVRRVSSVVVLAAIATIAIIVLRQKPGDAGVRSVDREQLKFGVALQSPSALAIIALEQGHFDREGLEVTVADYVSGKRALIGMLEGTVDVATTADVPIVYQSFQRDDFRVIATIAALENEPRIVARRDAGIATPADLAGKRVATQRASAVHFFLHMFMMKHELSDKNVTLSFMKAEALSTALANGEIDAFSMREPFVSDAVGKLGDNAIVFEEPRLYFRSEHVVMAAKSLADRPELAPRIVRGLLRAEAFARSNRKEAAGIVARKFGVPSEKIAPLLDGFELRVMLDQSLLNGFEDEARWMLDIGLVEQADVPNFLHYVDAAAMAEAKPEAVTIIR